MAKKTKDRVSLSILMGALILGSTLSGVSVANAAEEDKSGFVLDQMVVTASRMATTEFEANANINVITREDIEKNHYADLVEALRTVPGVTITRYGGSIGYEQSEEIRINGTGQIVVLIDGTRANMNGSTFNVFSFGAYRALDNVERIEILKGSASTLYGSDAKGGVINIITKKAGDKQKTVLSAETGSYDKEQYRLSHEGHDGDYSWLLGVQKDKMGSYEDANNFEIPSHLNAETINFKVSKKINDHSDLTMMYDKYTADYMFTGNNHETTSVNNGTADNYNWRIIHNTQFTEKENNQFSVYSQNTNTVNGASYADWKMDLQTIGFSDQYTNKISDKNTLVGGIDYYKDKVKDYQDSMVGNYSGKEMNNRSIYIQDSYDFAKQWNLTTGMRYDYHSKAGGETSPSATLDYKLSDKTHMFVGYKEYFVAPNQYQYFTPYGNEDLKPESGRTYDIGIHHAFDNDCTIRVHAFKRKAEDVIAFQSIYEGNTWVGGSYVNINEEKANGWDIQLDKKFDKNVKATAGYTHIVSKSINSGAESTNYYIPKGEYHISLDYTNQDFDASILGRGVIDRPGVITVSNVFPCDTYWVWDASLNYKVNKDVKVYLKANNLFDKYYAEHSNVQFGGAPGEWYSSPGRNFVVGMQYSF